METTPRPQRILWGTLCEIERGLFYASYRGGSPESKANEFPAYQAGSCALDAKQRIGETIRDLGYRAIIWEDALVVPPWLCHVLS